LDEVQAAFLDVKLKYLEAENQKRRIIAERYITEIKNSNVILPFPVSSEIVVSKNKEHVWHLFVIRCKNRDKLQKHLAENGIETLIHYPIPPNKQLAYAEMNHLDFPITNSIHEEVLSLPMSPIMADEEVTQVIAAINAFEN
jgi:dTDP-4-amino-4,6-dideoxygalactose transaminase